jgi:hypothetical protein
MVAGALLASLFVPAHAMATEGSFTVSNLVAETSLAIERANDGMIVVTVYIDRIKNSNTGATQDIPGGIGSYSATAFAGSGASIVGIRGVSPFDGPSFNAETGIFAVTTIASPAQPVHSAVANLIVQLTGNCQTPCSVEVMFQEIKSATDTTLNVPQEGPDLLPFLRGDARIDGIINIVDAMVIAQYTVGIRTLNEINGVNAASVKQDATGDVLNILDAMFIAQYTVGLRDSKFELL